MLFLTVMHETASHHGSGADRPATQCCEAASGALSGMWDMCSRKDRQMAGSAKLGICTDAVLPMRQVSVLFGKVGMFRNEHGSKAMLTFSKRIYRSNTVTAEAATQNDDSPIVGTELMQNAFGEVTRAFSQVNSCKKGLQSKIKQVK